MQIRLTDLKAVIDKLCYEGSGTYSNPSKDLVVELKLEEAGDNPHHPDMLTLRVNAKVKRYDGKLEDIELDAQVFAIEERQHPTIRKAQLIMGPPDEEDKEESPF